MKNDGENIKEKEKKLLEEYLEKKELNRVDENQVRIDWNSKSRRFCWLLSGLGFLFTFWIGLISGAFEIGLVLISGEIFDFLGGLVFLLIISLLGAFPYLLGLVTLTIIKRNVTSLIVSITCLIIFGFDLYHRIQFVFFPTNFTSGLGVMFLSFYLALASLVIFPVLALISLLYTPSRKKKR